MFYFAKFCFKVDGLESVFLNPALKRGKIKFTAAGCEIKTLIMLCQLTAKQATMEIIKIIIGQYQTNCYLIICDNEIAVIDPGADYQKIFEEIEKQKLMNASLFFKYIIITHHHFDHVNCISEVKQNYGGELLIHEFEKDYIDFAVDKFLKNGDKINIGSCQFDVLLTPGHTTGSICLVSDSAVFTGDTLFIHSYGRTDLPGGSKTEMEKSLALLNSIMKSGQTVYPGHGLSYMVR